MSKRKVSRHYRFSCHAGSPGEPDVEGIATEQEVRARLIYAALDVEPRLPTAHGERDAGAPRSVTGRHRRARG